MRAKTDGFLLYKRCNPPKRPVEQRLRDWDEIEQELDPAELERQAARCMDCGIPFCHGYGCPLGNRVPEFIEMASQGFWRDALELLHDTNNFPEITGRVCPAPCEAACTLGINRSAVTIRQLELRIVEHGFAQGWITPRPPARRLGREVAVVGSGPAGLAAAQQLARRGWRVTVFERDDKPGGLLRYGIPDFKLAKSAIERRLEQLRAEGVVFECGVDAGRDISTNYLERGFNAVLLSVGAGVPRDLRVPGREAAGIRFAVEYLSQQNQRVNALPIDPQRAIHAAGLRVVVIGGGDTGADCVGTANRQGAAAVTQLEIMPEPPVERPAQTPWPTWPQVLRTSSSHEEGCKRLWSVATRQFLTQDGRLTGLRCGRVEWERGPDGRPSMRELPDGEFELPADLALLALGFEHPEHGALVRDWGLELERNGAIAVDGRMMTSRPGVFAAGDAASGASLVVRAIAGGRAAAAAIDSFLRSLP